MAELASTVYEEGSEFTKMVVGQITAKVALVEKLFVKETHTQKLCVADESGAETCITKAQLDALISGAAGSQGGGSGGSGSGSGDITAPVLNFNGAAASSTIAIGSTYVDPVTATDETAPANPDVYASVNGATPILLSTLTLDTSTSTVYIIDYTATDTAGNVGTAQRTVEVVQE
jgi:hypothetical protein